MNGPTGLIFAMRSKFTSMDSTSEALFNEADTAFSAVGAGATTSGVGSGYTQNEGANTGTNVGFGTTQSGSGGNPALLNPTSGSPAHQFAYKTGRGMDTEKAEALGDGSGPNFNEMAFSIEKVTVTLAENVEFESENGYREKLETLKESYFPTTGTNTPTSKSEKLTEESEATDYQSKAVSNTMERYLQTINRVAKK